MAILEKQGLRGRRELDAAIGARDHLEAEEVGEEAATLGRAQEGGAHCGSQEEPLKVLDRFIGEVQKAERLLQRCASLDFHFPPCPCLSPPLVLHLVETFGKCF